MPLPCLCSGLCGDCAERLWASGPAGRRCPLCRSGFAGVMRIVEEEQVAHIDGGGDGGGGSGGGGTVI